MLTGKSAITNKKSTLNGAFLIGDANLAVYELKIYKDSKKQRPKKDTV